MHVWRRVKVETTATDDHRNRVCNNVASEEAGKGSEEEGETEDPWPVHFDVDNSFPSISFEKGVELE